MAKFYYGLDVNKYLGQLENTREALINLGLNPDDLDVIRGLSEANVTRNDIRNISGLDVDFKDELVKIYYGTSNYSIFIQNEKTIADDFPGNLQMNSQLGASSIKYQYINFEDSSLKYADISTSRVSSWSSFDSPVTETSPIYYGGKVTVSPDNGSSKLNITGLHKTTALKKRRFASEVPTHKVKLNINGSDMEFYAMRGIPLRFEAYYKNGLIKLKTTAPVDYPSLNVLITNTDNGNEKVYRNVGPNNQLRHYDTTSRPRLIEFYYDPQYMQELYLDSLNIINFPTTLLENMDKIHIRYNDFREMPNFKNIAPNLTELRITGNNLSRSTYTANHQLNNFLPSSIETLEVTGCFSDDTDVDLASFTNLKYLYHGAGYGNENYRKMTSTGTTHAVNPSTIDTYVVRGHDYTMLHQSLKIADKLRDIDISNNGLTDTNINFVSTELNIFRSDNSNGHNVVSVSGKEKLTEYYYKYSRNLSSLTTLQRTVDGKFDNCPNLNKIDLYGCNAIGNIETAFSNLGELKFLDVRYTAISGKITDTTFVRTNKLERLFIAGSNYDTRTDGPFISADGLSNLTKLKQLYIYGNFNITGNFPEISQLKDLDILYIENTGFTGFLPNLSTQNVIRIAILRNNMFDGVMPTIINNSIIDLRADSNNLESTKAAPFPYLECPKLRNLILFGNNFSGPITSFEGCPNLRQIDLSRNSFTSYSKGSLLTNKFLSSINISNNNLDKNSIFVFILDMLENWKSNNRSKVNIIFLGNDFTDSDIDNNQEVKDAIVFLRNQGWSITY